jgi:RecD/TraA family predicted helicase
VSGKTTKKDDLVKLDTQVIRYVWGKDDFAIYEVELLDSKNDKASSWISNTETVYIKGNFDRKFHYGESYIMYGTEVTHPKYGLQYDVKFVQAKFDTPERIKSFIYTMVAPAIADQLLKKYEGQDVMQLIIDNQVDYSDIKGMGDYRFNALREKVIENQEMKDLIIGLSQYGITPNQMKKIAMKFGARAIQAIEENPYVLCKIHGIGFMKADEVAKTMGFATDSPFRVREAIRYVLIESQGEGNSWLSMREVTQKTMELLGLRADYIEPEFENIEDVVVYDNRVAMLNVYNAEKYVAERLVEMNKKVNQKLKNFDMDAFIISMEEDKTLLPYGFTDEQKSFFYNVKNHGVNFLIGNAGCGKTFMMQFLLKILDKMHMTYLLCSPTGKASQVLKMYTNRDTSTIHRAFKIFGKDDGDPGEAKVGVYDDNVDFDESSMIGVITLAMALKGIKNENTMVLFIGDDFQLPSVEVGNFLHDAIKSGIFGVTKLTKVFRQKDGGILDAATKVRLGERFVENGFIGKREYGKDMLLHCCDPEHTDKGVIHYYKKALSDGYAPEDILVLSPTKKGPKGTKALNNAIQMLVNPQDGFKKEVALGKETIFREGDRVINIQNNYKALNVFEEETTIFNGDMGVIEQIDVENRKVIINYEGDAGRVITPFDSMNTVIHAWALTIHKSQGSGFKVVILLIDYSHQFQLNANLIYTGMTRAKEYMYVLGQADIINRAMKKNLSVGRNSFLCEFLLEESQRVA